MDKPFISVFTPNYNGSKYIGDCIQSILDQSYSNFEYIIIDDGSTDNSWDIIQQFSAKDDRIKVYRNERNLHVVRTRNKAFELCSPESKYFAILDSDDIALPDRLDHQIEFLEKNKDFGIIGSNITIIDEKSNIIGYREYPENDEALKKVILRYNPFTQSSIIIRRSVIEEVGMYDKKWKVCSDYDLWLRIGEKWKLANIQEYLVKYRLCRTQLKSTATKLTIQNTYRIQNNALKEYNYRDRFKNKLFRFGIFLASVFPKFAHYIYRTKFIKASDGYYFKP